jgi:hypothetical protein
MVVLGVELIVNTGTVLTTFYRGKIRY